MKSKLSWSGLALLFNLPFVVLHAHRMAFDTYTHLFLADHYRQTWWSQWEPRWYLGFSMASYPPLTHQLIALISWPISQLIAWVAPAAEAFPGEFRWMGEESAYVLVLLGILMLCPHALRAMLTLVLGERAAAQTAWLGIFTPALALDAWTFGQLPMLTATLWLLWACAFGARFLRDGAGRDLLWAALFAGLMAVTHHGAFLLAPAFGGLVVITHFAKRRNALRHQLLTALRADGLRLIGWGIAAAGSVGFLMLPFLAWSRAQTLQTAIPHASRNNFFADPTAPPLFFWPMYGPLLLLLPMLLIWAWRTARWRPLALMLLGLMVYGVGGTTPMPRWTFGAGWEWLTYDRFALGAALLMLAPFGVWARRAPPWLARVFVGAVILSAYAAGGISLWKPLQPPAIDLIPLIRFLAEPAQQPYRYLTLGFGEQLGKLSAITANGSPDGNYHTARPLPELRASGLGALDGAVWIPDGLDALRPILQRAPRYGARWIFVNHPAYEPLLRDLGWVYRFDVGPAQAWENAAIQPAPPTPPATERWAEWLWGLAPMGLLAVLLSGALWRGRAQWRAWLPNLRQILLGLWVITLFLWWLNILIPGLRPNLYFAYQSVLIYAGEALAVMLIGVWGLERITSGGPRAPALAPYEIAFLTLYGVSALSGITSSSPALTAGFLMHGGVLLGVYWVLRQTRLAPVRLGMLFGALLVWQTLVAFRQVLTQTSATGLHDWYLHWPGVIAAAERGASVVGTLAGGRWLRAYGTLPHPNMLGGALMVLLGGVSAAYVSTGRRRWLLFIALGATTLVLAFSRAAWVAGGVALWWIWFTANPATRPPLRWLIAISLLAAAVMAWPLRAYVIARLTAMTSPAVSLEFNSLLERVLQLDLGMKALAQHPWLGVGAGAFPFWLATQHLPVQPIHFLPLHIMAEIGLFGGVLAVYAVVLFGGFLWRGRRVASPLQRVWAGVGLGLLTIALFDHYWWTAPPMSMWLMLALAQLRAHWD
jgi:hypothetical protein